MALAAGVLEAEQVVKFAYGRLRADATLAGLLGSGRRIFRELADENAPFPHVTISPMSGVDTNTLTGVHVQQSVQILVKVNGQVRVGALDVYTALAPIAARVHAVLAEQGAAVVDGVYVVKLRRISTPYQPTEVRDGVRYPSLNQLFETEAQPA